MVHAFPTIAILGTGNMGGAILRGLLQPGVSVEGITVTTRSAESAARYSSDGVTALAVTEDPRANRLAVANADIIVLGVKPYLIVDLLKEISPYAKPDAVMVSMAAGITIAAMEQVWPGAVVRSMPNTPAEVGLGVTGLAIGQRVTADAHEKVRTLFATVGDVVDVAESAINALSSLSGSGPAYVYFLIERFIEVALEQGFSDDQARQMVEGTFHGALALLAHPGESPENLRTAVTSPGGTTEAALKVFANADLTAIIRDATNAAIARAEELASS
jgi:pyrroline-5-carboxylate reductase